MDPESRHRSPLAKRLREARQRLGVSQKELGVMAGIDEFSSSPRINQYEQDKHVPDFATARHLAKALGVSVTYLYTDDDEIAELILLFSAASNQARSIAKEALLNGKEA